MRTASSVRYSACHLSDSALRQEASVFAAGERFQFVQFLVRIAEIDVRKLYFAAGYPTMSAFFMEEFRLTEDEALKRLHAARTAREFPLLFEAMDEGRVSMTAVSMLAPHLTSENVHELVASAAACSRRGDLRLFLQRFAKPDLLSAAPAEMTQSHSLAPERPNGSEIAMAHSLAPERPNAPVGDCEWVEVRVKVRRSKLRRARDLLSHSVPSGNAMTIFDRALDALIEKAEKRKFAACEKARAPRPGAFRRQRAIPASVRRAVLERDGGQCTFVSDRGRRCASTRLLEFDHVVPVAQGGESSVEGLRLRCRGHNRYEAERAFGAAFMQKRREEARRERAEKRSAKGETGPPRGG